MADTVSKFKKNGPDFDSSTVVVPGSKVVDEAVEKLGKPDDKKADDKDDEKSGEKNDGSSGKDQNDKIYDYGFYDNRNFD